MFTKLKNLTRKKLTKNRSFSLFSLMRNFNPHLTLTKPTHDYSSHLGFPI